MLRDTVAILLSLLLSTLGTSRMLLSQTSTPSVQVAIAGNGQTASAHDGRGLAIKVVVNSVLLNVSVRDRHTNRSLAELRPGDFQVYENGVLQEVQSLGTVEVPFSLLLLMDVSGSTYSYMKLMKRAGVEFTMEIGEKDTIAVAGFNSKVRLLQGFTPNLGAAGKAIRRLRSGGGTAFYDALETSIDEYMRDVRGRKAVVVFTDGVDNALEGNLKEGSRISFEDLYRRLAETDTMIYTVFLDSKGKEIMPSSDPQTGRGGDSRPQIGRFPFPVPKGPSAFPLPIPSPIPKRAPGLKSLSGPEELAYETARGQLEEIADLTGGRTYSPRRPEELSAVYAEIADDLRIQYLLGYVSSNTAENDEWRSIRVYIRDHPEAVVRTRDGYSVKRQPASGARGKSVSLDGGRIP